MKLASAIVLYFFIISTKAGKDALLKTKNYGIDLKDLRANHEEGINFGTGAGISVPKKGARRNPFAPKEIELAEKPNQFTNVYQSGGNGIKVPISQPNIVVNHFVGPSDNSVQPDKIRFNELDPYTKFKLSHMSLNPYMLGKLYPASNQNPSKFPIHNLDEVKTFDAPVHKLETKKTVDDTLKTQPNLIWDNSNVNKQVYQPTHRPQIINQNKHHFTNVYQPSKVEIFSPKKLPTESEEVEEIDDGNFIFPTRVPFKVTQDYYQPISTALDKQGITDNKKDQRLKKIDFLGDALTGKNEAHPWHLGKQSKALPGKSTFAKYKDIIIDDESDPFEESGLKGSKDSKKDDIDNQGTEKSPRYIDFIDEDISPLKGKHKLSKWIKKHYTGVEDQDVKEADKTPFDDGTFSLDDEYFGKLKHESNHDPTQNEIKKSSSKKFKEPISEAGGLTNQLELLDNDEQNSQGGLLDDEIIEFSPDKLHKSNLKHQSPIKEKQIFKDKDVLHPDDDFNPLNSRRFPQNLSPDDDLDGLRSPQKQQPKKKSFENNPKLSAIHESFDDDYDLNDDSFDPRNSQGLDGETLKKPSKLDISKSKGDDQRGNLHNEGLSSSKSTFGNKQESHHDFEEDVLKSPRDERKSSGKKPIASKTKLQSGSNSKTSQAIDEDNIDNLSSGSNNKYKLNKSFIEDGYDSPFGKSFKAKNNIQPSSKKDKRINGEGNPQTTDNKSIKDDESLHIFPEDESDVDSLHMFPKSDEEGNPKINHLGDKKSTQTHPNVLNTPQKIQDFNKNDFVKGGVHPNGNAIPLVMTSNLDSNIQKQTTKDYTSPLQMTLDFDNDLINEDDAFDQNQLLKDPKNSPLHFIDGESTILNDPSKTKYNFLSSFDPFSSMNPQPFKQRFEKKSQDDPEQDVTPNFMKELNPHFEKTKNDHSERSSWSMNDDEGRFPRISIRRSKSSQNRDSPKIDIKKSSSKDDMEITFNNLKLFDEDDETINNNSFWDSRLTKKSFFFVPTIRIDPYASFSRMMTRKESIIQRTRRIKKVFLIEVIGCNRCMEDTHLNRFLQSRIH